MENEEKVNVKEKVEEEVDGRTRWKKEGERRWRWIRAEDEENEIQRNKIKKVNKREGESI